MTSTDNKKKFLKASRTKRFHINLVFHMKQKSALPGRVPESALFMTSLIQGSCSRTFVYTPGLHTQLLDQSEHALDHCKSATSNQNQLNSYSTFPNCLMRAKSRPTFLQMFSKQQNCVLKDFPNPDFRVLYLLEQLLST